MDLEEEGGGGGHAREPLYLNSAVIAWWLQSTSAQNSVPIVVVWPMLFSLIFADV